MISRTLQIIEDITSFFQVKYLSGLVEKRSQSELNNTSLAPSVPNFAKNLDRMKFAILTICFVAAHFMSVAGKSADVEAFLKHKAEGPVPQEITLIGALNGKTFFLERTTARTQAAGRAYCATLGMSLAKVENQNELNFINANIATSDDYLWTDGELVLTSSSFKWAADGSSIDPNLLIESGSSVGLTVSRYSLEARLHPSSSAESHSIICYIRNGSDE